MHARFQTSVCLLPPTLLILASLSAAQDPCALEPDTPCVEGPAPVTLCYGEWTACAIDFSSDLDSFRFLGKAGDEVHFYLSGVSVCLDPRIQVRDPANATILDESCQVNCGSACTVPEQVLVLPMDGSYTILVSDLGNTETGAYQLAIEKFQPDYPLLSLTYAAPLQCVEIDHRGDNDFVTFEGLAGSEVLLQTTGMDVCIDPAVQVYLPSGSLLMENSCGVNCGASCSYPLNFPSLPETGTYLVRVYDAGFTEGGTIGVGVQCVFSPAMSGLCPDPYVNASIGAPFCTSNANSTGNAATLSATGSVSIGENRVHLVGSDAPPAQFGLFFAGMNTTAAPHPSLPAPSQGLLCVNVPFHRFGVIQSCWTGQFGMRVDFDALPVGMVVLPGETWNFQLWYRDAAVSNTSDGIEFTFQP